MEFCANLCICQSFNPVFCFMNLLHYWRVILRVYWKESLWYFALSSFFLIRHFTNMIWKEFRRYCLNMLLCEEGFEKKNNTVHFFHTLRMRWVWVINFFNYPKTWGGICIFPIHERFFDFSFVNCILTCLWAE
jgi:hypothetical protein